MHSVYICERYVNLNYIHFICLPLKNSMFTPHVADELLELLIHIPEVPSSNLDPETRYPDLYFSWVSSVLPANAGIVP
jgi:hypothetical protein